MSGPPIRDRQGDMERLYQFFSDNYMAPHGFCFMWLPEILWLHVAADLLIAIAYFSIPLALWRFARRRPDMPFNRLFILFATFITLCGLTHLFGILVLWKPYYGIEGLLMLATGIVSATTAVLVWRILPSAIMLPSPSQLAEMNERLSRTYEETERQVQDRTRELQDANVKLEEERRRADEASQAKSEFLANMSHEIRTPMNVVLGLAKILSEGEPLSDRQKKYLETLDVSAKSLLALIDDLLDIARIESNTQSITYVPVNITDIARETVDILEVRAQEKGLRMQMVLEDPGLAAHWHRADPKRLRQILYNLCGNAIKFTKAGGITVALSRDSSTPVREGIILRVSDTGIGIAPAEQGRIFEKFVQVDPSLNREYGGTGLGLAITKMLIDQMGGAISLESELGKGSTFTVVLPLERAEKPASKAVAVDSAQDKPVQVSGAGPKILLVEDYEPNILVATVFLEQAGFSYEIARDGLGAVEKRREGSFDAILMDVQMPLRNGWDATRDIRAYESENGLRPIPVIGMTAHAFKEDIDRCLESGMNDYIAKPYTADDLIEKLRHWTKSKGAA